MIKQPRCPRCQYEFDAENIYYSSAMSFPTESDGDETETHCINCEAELLITVVFHPEWKFLDDDGEEL